MKPLSMVALLITLSACAPQKLTQTQCVVEHIAGFETTGNREHLTVAENSSPCVMHLTTSQSGLRGQLTTQPAHGTAYLQDATLQPDGFPPRTHRPEERLANPEISRFPRKERPYMPGSPTTPDRMDARNSAPVRVAFRLR